MSYIKQILATPFYIIAAIFYLIVLLFDFLAEWSRDMGEMIDD
jgi:hypothetical protein